MHFVPTRGEQVPQLMAAVLAGVETIWCRRAKHRRGHADHRWWGQTATARGTTGLVASIVQLHQEKSEHSEHGGSKGPRLCRRCRVCLRVPQKLAIFILTGISLSRMRVAMTRTPGSSGTVNQNISASRCNDLSQNGWELSCLLACYWYGGRGPWPDRLPKSTFKCPANFCHA